MRKAIGVLVAALTLGAMTQAGAGAPAGDLIPIARVRYTGGTELDFSGKYLYAAQMDGTFNRGEEPEKGGVFIFDISKPGQPKKVGFLDCPGDDNDVHVVKPGLIAMAFHQNRCGPGGNGMLLADVSRPSQPRVIGMVSVKSGHTLTPYPGKPYIYVHSGGIAYTGAEEVIVDISDPSKPEIVNTFKPNQNGCHDMSFRITPKEKLGFCPGLGEVQIWDVSDPEKPVTISSIYNPAIQFGHYAQASPDGKILVINDEAFVAHECGSGQSPFGSLWVYDISDPAAPTMLSHFSPPRGRQPFATEQDWVDAWCTSHQFDFIDDTRYLLVPWFTGGVTMIDLTDPAAPVEMANYTPDDAVAYSSQYYRGHAFVSDMARGLEVLEVALPVPEARRRP
jgi:hypothetical protein